MSSITLDDLAMTIFDIAYPINSILCTTDQREPSTYITGGAHSRWEMIVDRMIIGAGNQYTAQSIGGSSTHQLTIDQMPSHNHALTKRVTMINNTGAFTINDQNCDGLVASDNIATNYGVDVTDSIKSSWISSSGNNQPFSLLNPYYAAYFWKRVQ